MGLTESGSALEDSDGKRALLREARAKMALLSPRQREVIELLAEGLSTKEIARQLGVSPRTVDVHRGQAFFKLQARSSVDATRIAIHAALAEEFGE